MSGFDMQWVDGSFSAEAVALEVESHFERLLVRGNLRVAVTDADTGDCITCNPLDYSRLGDDDDGEGNGIAADFHGKAKPRVGIPGNSREFPFPGIPIPTLGGAMP